ncbi:MAG: glycosyltransferase family 2 protein [Pseudomonadota bacterium]
MAFQLFSVIRDEGPFLLEWIAYHNSIGFNRIVLFDDGSTDGTPELLAALSEHAEIRHEVLTVPHGRAPQTFGGDILRTGPYWQNGEWMLWLDPDEFWVPGDAENLNNWLKALGKRFPTDFDGICLHWRIFGDAGREQWPGWQLGTGFERASLRRFWPGQFFKTLFRMNDALAEIRVHRPVLSRQKQTVPPVFYAGNAAVVPEGFWSHDMPQGVPPSTLSFSGRPYALGQVNHYMVRTPDAFSLKSHRGRGAVARATAQDRPRYTPGYYSRFNRNETGDKRIDPLLPAYLTRRESYLADPKVRAAHEACCRAAGFLHFG